VTKKELLVALKAKLVAQNWTGSANRVFPTGSVLVTRGLAVDEAFRGGLRTPFALIVPGAAQADPQHGEDPKLMVGEVVIRIGALIPGDAVGENPLLGANRVSSVKSEGAGLFDVEAELFNAVGFLNAEESIVLQYKNAGDRGSIMLEDKSYIAYEDHVYEGIWTAA
jgi:hypothetical protein